MSTPRIDTTRNLLDGAILLLAEFRAEVHDLHDLATNRTRAAAAERVRGGSRDHALDTHGDPEARRLYIDAVRAVLKALDPVEDAIQSVRSYITEGQGSARFDRSAVAPKGQVAAAIRRAADRRGRSNVLDMEPPHPIVAQPPVAHTEPKLERDQLRAAVQKMCDIRPRERDRFTTAEAEAWERAFVVEPKDVDGELANLTAALRKVAMGRKPDRSRLTPQEQDAWRKALQVEQIDKAG